MSWGYGDTDGPDHWYEHCPIANTGKRQSPINIETSKAENKEYSPFKIAYEDETNMKLENTGTSVKAQIEKKSVISGGPLDGEYILAQFHLHWGKENGKGSEHTIDGKTYDAELHMVHYAAKYGSFEKAVSEPDGLAVLGFMVQVGRKHDGFEKISDELKTICPSGCKCQVVTFNPSCLFSDLRKYWTYEGSLTTPPLLECVIWIVFKEPIQISSAQMESLRSLRTKEGMPLVNNYRPPCTALEQIEGRTVVSCTAVKH